METIKVNMTPCEDIKTIHASQNDNEARQWGFELHNNGEKIDSSSISDQMVFKSYEGGTEEILPTNGSTPATSPFKGDIRYPQGLLTDQEFLYRESPSEEDGLAKITDIKGNTLVWNQLVQKGNFESIDGWRNPNGTASVSDNVLTVTATDSNLQIYRGSTYALTQGHKIYISCWIKSSVAKNDVRLRISQNNPLANVQYISKDLNANVRTNISGIIAVESNTTNSRFSIFVQNSADGEVYTVDSFVAFDLTQMGLDSISASDFTSLFSLPYYAYNQGTLLSFNGTGLKTVGKNQCNADDVQVGKAWNNASNSARAVLFAPIRPNTQYTISITSLGTTEGVFIVEESGIGIINGVSASLDNSTKSFTFTSKSDSKYLALQCNKTAITKSDFESVKFMLEHGATASSYEPYTSSTLSLPISTYFPNGMDGINDVWDEKNETGYVKRIGTIVLNGSELWHSPDSSGNCWINLYAMKRSLDYRETMKSNIAVSQSCRAMNTTEVSVSGYPSEQSDGTNWLYIRLPNQDQTIANITAYLQEHPVTVEFELYNPLENYGVVDMGSLNWSRRNDVNGAFFTKIDDMALGVANKLSNLLCPLYATRNTAYYGQLSSFVNMEIAQGNATQGEVYLINTSYSDVATFKTAMSGVYLLYEKQNPQGFTTATLVTENGEVALANENGVLVGKCNSDVSADAGFIEGKIKLSDSDGDVYSNKIQIHVERSPQ